MCVSNQKLVIAGAYGCGNVGDDAILAGLLKRFRPEQFDITVFTADAVQTKKQFKIKTVRQKLNVGFSLKILKEFEFIKMIRAISTADILIIGGGALIHDLRPYNLPYFFALHALARMSGAKVLYFGIGVGPLTTGLGQWLCRRMLPKANHISVRDPEGKVWLQKAGVQADVVVSADPAFALGPGDIDKGRIKQVLRMENVPASYISTTVCGWFRSSDFWRRNQLDLKQGILRMAEIYDFLIRRYRKAVLFVPTVVPYDRELAIQIRKHMKNPDGFYCLKQDYSPSELMGIVAGSEWLLGMRLHSMIFATIMQIPFLGIIYDQKVDHFMKMIQNDCTVDMDGLFNDTIFQSLNTFNKNRRILKTRLGKAYRLLHHNMMTSYSI